MIPFHPIANLFPLIEGPEFDELVDDIRQNGLHEEIVLLDGQILDGRNRYRASIAAGLFEADVDPATDWHFIQFAAGGLDGVFSQEVVDKGPLAWVLSKNLHRRHLTDRQRVMIAAEIATRKQGRPSQWRDPLSVVSRGEPQETGQLASLPEDEPRQQDAGAESATVSRDTKPANRPDFDGVTQAEAAELLHVPERQVRRGRQVFESGVPELIEAAKRGDIAPSAAEQIARLPEAEQREELAAALKPRGARSIMASRTEPDDSLDYFPTPPWATRALIEDVLGEIVIGSPPAGPRPIGECSVWEPACGEGHIAGVLQEYGCPVIASDIFDYSVDGRSPPGWAGQVDFLDPEARNLGGFDWIITNPPFEDKALAFVERALDKAAYGVAMFFRSQWAVEGVERYERLFSKMPPTVTAFFSERVNLRRGYWDPEGSTATAYCWLVWVKNWAPQPTMWIPPGRRIERTRPDDVARFTAHPVVPFEFPAAAEGSGATGGVEVGGGGEAESEAAEGNEAVAAASDPNAIIRDGYAEIPFPGLDELARRTGLTENAVKQRAKRMQLGDRERQREAVSRMNAQRRGTGHASHA